MVIQAKVCRTYALRTGEPTRDIGSCRPPDGCPCDAVVRNLRSWGCPPHTLYWRDVRCSAWDCLVRAVQARYIEQSVEVDPVTWAQRPWWRWIPEHAAKLLSPLL